MTIPYIQSSNTFHPIPENDPPALKKINSCSFIVRSAINASQQNLNKAKECANNLLPLKKKFSNEEEIVAQDYINPYHLRELVFQIMSELSDHSRREGVPIGYQINENDKKIAGKISYIIEKAKNEGKDSLDFLLNDLSDIIENYHKQPSLSRFQLSKLIYDKYLEELLHSPSASNKKFMEKFEHLLEKRLNVYKGMSNKNYPCPIGSFGEKPAKWFKSYPPKHSEDSRVARLAKERCHFFKEREESLRLGKATFDR